MKLNIGQPSEEKQNSAKAEGSFEDAVEASNPARRRFTRSAVVGSAVVFSLANRPAWSQTCVDNVSTGFLNSVSHASHDPGGDHLNDYEAKIQTWNDEINALTGNEEYVLSIGPHPTDPNKQCLISTLKQ